MTDLVTIPFALNGDKIAPPGATDPNGFVSFNLGYTPNYELDLSTNNNSAHPVERQVMNYMFNLLTNVAVEFQQFGYSTWFSAMPGGYDVGAMVRRRNVANTAWVVWQSNVSSNIVDPNAVAQTSWSPVQSSLALLSNIPMPAGAGTPANEMILASVNFNTLTASATFETGSDAIASGSANCPSSVSGVLMVKTWVNGGNTYVWQGYWDRSGNAYARGSLNGTWTAWQRPLGSYSNDLSYSASTTLGVAQSGAQVRFTGSTAAQTLTVPAISALVPGTALQLCNQASVPVTATCQGADQFTAGSAFSGASVVIPPGTTLQIVAQTGGNYAIGGTASLQFFQYGIMPISVVAGTTHSPAFGSNYVYTNTGGCVITVPQTSLLAGQHFKTTDVSSSSASTALVGSVPVNGQTVNAGTVLLNVKYSALEWVYINSTVGYILQ